MLLNTILVNILEYFKKALKVSLATTAIRYFNFAILLLHNVYFTFDAHSYIQCYRIYNFYIKKYNEM